MNNRNIVGAAIFVRDMGVYPAPKGDAPLPGSIVRVDASGAVVMSDAAPAPLIMGAQYAEAQPKPQYPTPSPPEIKPVNPNTGVPQNLPPAANDNEYRRRGTYGRPATGAAARVLGLLGLASAGYELGDMAGQWYVGPDAVTGRAIGDHLRGQVSAFSEQGSYIADLPWHFGSSSHVNTANDLLSLKAGYKVDYRTMDPAELEELLNREWPPAAQLKKNAETRTEPKPKAEPVPASDTTRVDRAKC